MRRIESALNFLTSSRNDICFRTYLYDSESLDAVSLPRIVTELLRGTISTGGAFLLSNVIGMPPTPPTADVHSLVFLSERWRSLAHDLDSPCRRRYYYYVVPSDDYDAELLDVFSVRDILSVFQDQVHVLVEGLKFPSETLSTLQPYQYLFAEAFVQYLCRRFGQIRSTFVGA